MKALVTGATGFLGRRIVEMLCARGDEVVAFVRQHPSSLRNAGKSRVARVSNPWAHRLETGATQDGETGAAQDGETGAARDRDRHLEAIGARLAFGDVRDLPSIESACTGVDAVFHTAALTGIWGPRRSFWETNVDGTRHVISACRSAGVPKLNFTSSPSVVFGEDDLCGVDERQPYPAKFLAHYPETKAVAERMVLAANGRGLSTVALRPHLIWGPGDPHLIPRVVARARAGRLVQVGEGNNRVDITYIDNAADAHLRACDALHERALCAGKVYFIGQSEPVNLWGWLNSLLVGLGVSPVSRTMSYATARRLGSILETAYGVFRFRVEPRMTRFLAAQLAKSHYFDHSAARAEIGYEAKVSTEEGVRRLVEAMRMGEAESRLRDAPRASNVLSP